MKKAVNFLLLIGSILIVPAQRVQSQSYRQLRVGDQVPDSVYNSLFGKFNKKLVILDFWSTSCSVCIASFPKIEDLNTRFSDKVQFILVNSFETEKQVKERLAGIQARNSHVRLPDVPSIIGDTLLKQLFPHQVVPHHVWIDEAGRVAAITNGYNTNEENLFKYFDTGSIKVGKKTDLDRDIFDHQALARFADRGTHRYSASFWSFEAALENTHFVELIRDSLANTLRNTYPNMSVGELYYFAFKDDISPSLGPSHIVWDIPDSLQFGNVVAIPKDDWDDRYKFSYEQEIAIADSCEMKRRMQNDLNAYFGELFGVEGTIKTKKVNCLVISSTKKQSCRNDVISADDNEITSIQQLMRVLRFRHPNVLNIDNYPLISTDTPDRLITVRLKHQYFDFNELKEDLAQNGIDVRYQKKRFEVLLISMKQRISRR